MADLKLKHTLKYVTEYEVMSAVRRGDEFLILTPCDDTDIAGFAGLRRGIPLPQYAKEHGVSIVDIIPARGDKVSRDLFVVIFQRARFSGVISAHGDPKLDKDYATMLAGTMAGALSFLVDDTEVNGNGHMIYEAHVEDVEGVLSYGEVLAMLHTLAQAHPLGGAQ